MNRENVLKVADAIEQHSIPDLGFDMSCLLYVDRADPDDPDHCGTAACVAGWTVCVKNGGLVDEERRGMVEEARKWLQLDADSAQALFYPYGWMGARQYPPAQAVAVLRHLAETGEVDWSVADTVKA